MILRYLPNLLCVFRMLLVYPTALGIFGAPSFTVGEDLFWGNDRLEAALDCWKKRNP